jgi:hypothetical protein
MSRHANGHVQLSSLHLHRPAKYWPSMVPNVKRNRCRTVSFFGRDAFWISRLTKFGKKVKCDRVGPSPGVRSKDPNSEIRKRPSKQKMSEQNDTNDDNINKRVHRRQGTVLP